MHWLDKIVAGAAAAGALAGGIWAYGLINDAGVIPVPLAPSPIEEPRPATAEKIAPMLDQPDAPEVRALPKANRLPTVDGIAWRQDEEEPEGESGPEIIGSPEFVRLTRQALAMIRGTEWERYPAAIRSISEVAAADMPRGFTGRHAAASIMRGDMRAPIETARTGRTEWAGTLIHEGAHAVNPGWPHAVVYGIQADWLEQHGARRAAQWARYAQQAAP